MVQTFVHRLVGAAMLDVATFEDVETDRAATPQALAIVVCSAVAAGIGARGSSGGAVTFSFFVSASVLALTVWAAFALLIFEVGARILPTADTRVDVGELLRTLGFAAAPGLIQIFAIFPRATVPVFTLAIVWALAASVVAVRQALDYRSTGRALAVCVIAMLLSVGMAIVIGLIFGPTLSGV